MSGNPPPVDLSTLLICVQRFAATFYPGVPVETLTITLKGCPPISIPVPAGPVKPMPGPKPKLTERQMDLLAALEESEKDVMIGKEIAAKAGYEFEPELRKDLAKLVKDGLLVSCHPGYKLAGEAAVE